MVAKSNQFKRRGFTAVGGWDGTPTHVADCDSCGGVHPAEYHHDSQWGDHGPVYGVICPKDEMTDWYTADGVREYVPPKRARR